ncbi:sensor histidine kinase [Flavobacterium cellulosilyticum]|uniref:histidine kinase n=1 Tax=Flavobacterium cellulosilyticum TaxID=2541731 RepID=A0A4R5C520_9FLAO|nr:HAMP domain-containing sensor histidine kinase [Flavobacterium cellulosilyticum]TDD93546.1 HAMP domain-containing histidine kinase [Flavobacterium cellulosilyticum]
MKLKHRLSLFNIGTKLLLIVILWFTLPYIVKKVIYNNADDELVEKKEKFVHKLDSKEIQDFLLANDSTEVYGNFTILHKEFTQLEVSPNQKTISKDVFFNDIRSIENQESEYRILQHNFKYNNANYQLEIGSNINELNDLIDLLHYIIIITFLLVALFTFVIDGLYISYLLKPFYKIVETKINLINEPEKFNHTIIESKTSEFQELDSALNQMMHRITDLFLKEKQFIGNVSHELLTPIAILKNRFENLIQNQSLDNTAVDKISDSLNTLDSMKKVISNLLLISRIDNKQYQINEEINFDAIISELLENLDDRIQDKNLKITKNIKHQVSFLGNQTLIKILFSNLFTNAIKYNTQNGIIIINDSHIAEKYELTISDTGLGMNKEEAAQIFERFTRIQFDQEGHGIGLAIVDSIAKLHQIEIQVESEINQGTIFRLIFPLSIINTL